MEKAVFRIWIYLFLIQILPMKKTVLDPTKTPGSGSETLSKRIHNYRSAVVSAELLHLGFSNDDINHESDFIDTKAD